MSIIANEEYSSVCRLFGVVNGKIFSYWRENGRMSNEDVFKLFFYACGIDIKENIYSEQELFDMIVKEQSDESIFSLLNRMRFLYIAERDDNWTRQERADYETLENLLERLDYEL